MFGCEVTSLQRVFFFLPPRIGRLGIFKPNDTSEMLYSCSRDSTQLIANVISGSQEFETDTHISRMLEVTVDYE